MSDEGIDVLADIEVILAEMARDGVALDMHYETLDQARAAVDELFQAASEMNRLAKGPAGGVSQTDKRAAVDRLTAALARVRSS